MRDFLRFLFMLSVILSGLSLIWFGLYLYGSSKPKDTYQTELVQRISQESPILIYQSIPFRKDQTIKPFMAIEIFFENDNWLVRAEPQNRPLDSFLEEQASVTFFVHLRLNQTSKAASLKALVDKDKNWERLVFVSDSDGTLKDLRELNPRWTFTNGEVFLARFTSFASLGLHGLLNIPSDVFYVNPDTFPIKSLLLVTEEAKKQNKLVVLGPVKSARELKNIDGWVLVKD